jgi:hypothetical protein
MRRYYFEARGIMKVAVTRATAGRAPASRL